MAEEFFEPRVNGIVRATPVRGGFVGFARQFVVNSMMSRSPVCGGFVGFTLARSWWIRWVRARPFVVDSMMYRSSVRGGFVEFALVRPGASSLRSHRPGLHKERPCGARARWMELDRRKVWASIMIMGRRWSPPPSHSLRNPTPTACPDKSLVRALLPLPAPQARARAPQGRSLCSPGRCERSELAPGRTSETSSDPPRTDER